VDVDIADDTMTGPDGDAGTSVCSLVHSLLCHTMGTKDYLGNTWLSGFVFTLCCSLESKGYSVMYGGIHYQSAILFP